MGLSWQWPIVAGRAGTRHVLLGMGPARGGPRCPSVRLLISHGVCSRTWGCTSGTSAQPPGVRPASPFLCRAAQWPGQASSCVTWKGTLEAGIKIDSTPFQGSGIFTFSPAGSVGALAGHRIHSRQAKV